MLTLPDLPTTLLTEAEATSTYLPLAGGTLTGDLVLSEATPTVSLKLAADTQPRSRLTDTALGFGPGGSTAPDATLSRTGAGALRVDSHLGVGVNPAAWAPTRRAIQVGQAGVVSADTTTNSLYLATNTTYDGTSNKAIIADAAILLALTAGTMTAYTAPSVAAGAAQTFTTRMNLAPTGTLTLTPDAGQDALAFGSGRLSGTATEATLFTAGSARAQLHSASGAVTPAADNVNSLGSATPLRWSTVYAVAGAINTSSAAVKEGITPLDPARAMDAVRNTEAVTFDYVAPARGPEWYDLPDDPEQAEAVLAQRLTAAPLEAAARHQAGFISEDADELFLVGEGQTSPGNSVGILLAALQQLDQRVQALEGA